MREESFLITNEGKRCRILIPDFGPPDGVFQARSRAIDCAVREKGWIGVDYCEARQEIKLTFRAFDVADPAVTAACALLLVPVLTSVGLKYDFHGWRSESFRDGTAAGMRLMEIVQAAEQSRHRTEFFASAKEPESLLRDRLDERCRLGGLLQLWRDTRGVFGQRTVPLLRDLGLISRTLMIEPDGNTGCGKFTFIGSDFTVYGANWPHEGIGQPVEEQFDTGYGTWVSKALKVMLQTGLPQYEHVDARIRRPNGEVRRSRYICLRTIWRDENNHPILMTNSLISPHVDIPLVPAQNTVV